MAKIQYAITPYPHHDRPEFSADPGMQVTNLAWAVARAAVLSAQNQVVFAVWAMHDTGELVELMLFFKGSCIYEQQ